MQHSQKILISGASGALGSALAKTFAKDPAVELALFYGSNAADISALEKDCKAAGVQKVFSVSSDIRNRDDISRGFTNIDKIDRAVLCAGITSDAPLATMTAEKWQEVIDTNLTGTKNMLVEVARKIPDGGSIIIIGSIRGVTGAWGQANYAASKAGLVALVRSVARELGEQNIRVNLVLPGIMQSKMTQDVDMDAATKENVLGRTNSLDEIARAIVFLSSLENVSGQTFNLDSRIF